MDTIATTRPRTRRRWLTQRRIEAIEGYLLASPWFVGLALLTVVPFFLSIYYSFTDYEIIKEPSFVGLKNYIKLFSADVQFWKALSNTGFMVLNARSGPPTMMVRLAALAPTSPPETGASR